MIKYLLILTLFISGCTYYVSSEELEILNDVCANNGGIDRIETPFGTYAGVFCKNGVRYDINTEVINEKRSSKNRRI